MRLRYFKMLGAGNRILVVDQRDENLPPPPASDLRRLASDKSGPGFDQLMWVGPPRDPSAAASYRVFNADGSEVEQCGNGARCVVSLLAREDDTQRRYTLESPAGLIEATLVDGENVAVNMGPPEFDPERVPFVAPARQERYQIEVAGQTVEASVLSMGNPHCVLQVDDVATAAVGELGPALERHERFPAAANIGFMCVRDRENIDLRVHERGVGETLACGTGACAAVVAGQRLGQLGERVAVQLPGGQLMVSWRGGAEPVWLIGNAELIGEGTIDL
jgi:diaminopimelate epimerase